MSENKNRDSIKPDSTQDNLTPLNSLETSPEKQVGDGHTHEGERNGDAGEPNIASVMRQAEWPMIILTAIIALATAANVIVYYCESESTSKQTQKLTDAANIQSTAASDMATAAGDPS